MPFNKTWSKTEQKWVTVEKERKMSHDRTKEEDESWALLLSYWRSAPDTLLDLLESDTPHYELALIQRVIIRTFCLFQEVFDTGSRGLTKTYCLWLASLLMGILYPGTIKRYFAPTLKQAAEIASAIYKEIQHNYPGLCAHWKVISDAQERFEVGTEFGSVISINAMRGDTAHGVLAEEVAQEAEAGQPFDHEKFRNSILPSVRAKRMVAKEADPNYPNFQKLYITSAGRQQNYAFDYRNSALKDMKEGRNAFAMDIPAEVSVLSGIRDISWYRDLKRKLSPEEWMREMASIWTGTSENPVIRDSVLTESKLVTVMEDRHCGNPNVFYIIGYDVSYIDGSVNAKCATVVMKCERQPDRFRSDRYKKSVVYVHDEPPPRDSMAQAMRLKSRWERFSLECAPDPCYIAIDSAAYGKSVVEDLHKDLGDGLPPLCCINHDLSEMELDGALPVVYPIRATGGLSGLHDSDSEMLKYAELEFEHGNVRILCATIADGVEAYKRTHRIKDDSIDAQIARPYIKTKEMCAQIGNLKKKISGLGMREERISKHINRDMWSALKYALRLAQILEKKEFVESLKRTNPWEKEYERLKSGEAVFAESISSRVIERRGGNMRE